MSASTRRVRTWSLVCSLVLVSLVLGLAPEVVRAESIPAGLSQQTGVGLADDGSLTLVGHTPAPASLGAFARFGTFTAAVTRLTSPASRVLVRYEANTPPGTLALLDVRASSDGQRWSEWRSGLAADAEARFGYSMRYVQYRVRLAASGAASPSLRAVTLSGVAGTAVARPADEGVAPTFTVRATRQGMVGGRTANGHIITSGDRYVSLPCWCALNDKGGRDYQVRLSANGRSTVVPVWDVGPWNTHDDYWNAERETFSDLPQGWPQDHAAYYDGYNNGYAAKGYVTFPTAVDIGDGAWWDDLGMDGDQGEVEITFLWLGRDPAE